MEMHFMSVWWSLRELLMEMAMAKRYHHRFLQVLGMSMKYVEENERVRESRIKMSER